MTDISQFSDQFLATCVDEYMSRIVSRVRNRGNNEWLYASVTIGCYGSDTDPDITHNIQIGSGIGKQDINSNNSLDAIDKVLKRMEEDKANAPNKVCLSLPSPQPPYEAIEDAEFEDDIPF